MKVNFLLPNPPFNPSGGYKIAYEYANRLAEKGNIVKIIYPAYISKKENKIKKILRFLRAIMYCLHNSFVRISCRSWFDLRNEIKEKLVFEFKENNIPDADATVATAWITAEYLNDFSCKKGRKYYLIQSVEDWCGDLESVIATWKMPLNKIVISNSLMKFSNELNEKSFLIENGLDFTKFYKLDIKKNQNQIMMLYHSNEKVKQSKKALKELIELKVKIKNLKIVLFGVEKRPSNLENWIEYYQKPKIEVLRKLYNESTIFLSPSKIEGWALPPAEAMQCGTCVCVTNIPGHDYVVHLENGYKIDDNLTTLQESLIYLLSEGKVRNHLENSAGVFISQFTWERAFENFYKTIKL